MAATDFQFVIGITNLRELAEERGLRHEVSPGGEERVIDRDGTVLVRCNTADLRKRAPKHKDPTVWMRSIKYHTYQGRPQVEGSIYLCREDEVENIETLKMAVREGAPRRAVRRPTK